MKLIQKTDNKLIFQAEIEESLVNAIRRYLNHVFILAVEEVDIKKNDSPLYDETVAHRIGLIPLKTSKTTNEKTTAEIKLIAKKEGLVYSEEFGGDVKPSYNKIPITSLEKGQELEIIAKVKAGKGEIHSKFSPGLIFYRNVFDIKVDKDCPNEIFEVCPKKILKSKDGKIIVGDNSKCDMCEACMEFCEKRGKNSIKVFPSNELMITIESFGQMNSEDMFNKSIGALKKDLDDISKGVK